MSITGEQAVTDRPIIFSAPMVRALLDGRKTQTRRKFELPARYREPLCATPNVRESRWQRGDRLWVREAFAKVGDIDDDIHACPDLRIHAYYRADAVDPERQRWRSPIHMPRWASRLTLTVTEVRVQRLQEISKIDCDAEGVEMFHSPTGGGFRDYSRPETLDVKREYLLRDPRDSYRTLWNSLHGPDAWGENPWVVALTFTVQRWNIDSLHPTL